MPWAKWQQGKPLRLASYLLFKDVRKLVVHLRAHVFSRMSSAARNPAGNSSWGPPPGKAMPLFVTSFRSSFALSLHSVLSIGTSGYLLGLITALSGIMLLMNPTTSNAADLRGELKTPPRLPSSTSLKALPASPGVCYAKPESTAETKPVNANLERRIRDRSCHVSVTSVRKELLTGRVALIDVRHADAFNRYNIPASLNIPLYAVKTKAFLKDKHVVLLNEGTSATTLEQACSDLRRTGFSKVSIMEGGLHAWAGQGGSIAGDILAVDQLKWMTSQDLFAERQYDDWIVFDFSAKQDPAMRQWLPKKLESVKFSAKAAAIVKVATAGKKGQDRAFHNILIVNEKGAGYEKIESLMRKAGLKQIYYLQGGLAGYRDFLTQQTAMWNQKDKPLKLPACQS